MRADQIAGKTLSIVIVACCLSLLSCFGCAFTPYGIPTGEWSGEGIYLDYEATVKEKMTDTTHSRSRDNVYETSLKISQQRMYGHETFVFDIRSKRDKLFNLNDKESHVTFTLVPLKTLEHGSRLYAIGQWEYNPSKDRRVSEEEFNKRLQTASASCINQDGATILQVYYTMPTKSDPVSFCDTFVFENHKVRKTGRIIEVKTTKKENEPIQNKLMKVYWAETLKREK
ncbi:MAG: hypothetical protein JSV03_12860 [Planctomycetota bacterium]|nr:MAG: hypothetical protein JSV03_12860 [Planctomycetota bacterium]